MQAPKGNTVNRSSVTVRAAIDCIFFRNLQKSGKFLRNMLTSIPAAQDNGDLISYKQISFITSGI